MNYLIVATRTINYEIPVSAMDAEFALKQLDSWISDDFENYEVSGSWDFEVLENE